MKTSILPSLSLATLDRIAPDLRPAVDPRELRPKVVHFGLGAFHRAHQAVYTESAAARSGEPWGIVAVAPRSTRVVKAMRVQDCLYSVAEHHPAATTTRAIGSIVGALGMRQDAERVDELLADPGVTVATLTITEAGHYRRPGADGLDTGAPEIAADLAAARTADITTVVGRLAVGLAARMRAGGAPISVVSCDNMAANGAALGTVVRGFVEASSWPDRRAVLDWMATSVAFPATIVDRIVPATTDADREAARAALGVWDEVPVVGEPYRQWVLEDSFAGPRPPWELDGALFVPDVVPYQLTKLRLLNGSHSALAYLGAAAGCATIADVLETGWGERLVRALSAEVAPTLPEGGPDPVTYTDDLVKRFRNRKIRHLLRQIGSDGSRKIPERWFGALRSLRAERAGTPALELALAAWANATRPADDGRPSGATDPTGRPFGAPDPTGRPFGAPDPTGQLFGTTDPAAAQLAACWHEAADQEDTIRRLLHVLGAADLAGDGALIAGTAARLPALRAGHVEI
ncbi:mannitol dehydrogenase family protein [Nonomuraea sp. NPDC050022]|uniref:mannitol dehydrogenase family protein n=1 Tax=Nonomuraea sp. NPDC050022 TaxID=3364358 RepID=UPI0037ACB9AD